MLSLITKRPNCLCMEKDYLKSHLQIKIYKHLIKA